jgi:DNA adenine methylase
MTSLNRVRSFPSSQKSRIQQNNLEVDMFPDMNPKIESVSCPKPFIKWVGGKHSIVNKLISFFPKDFATYFEPFLGGGSVFFNLKHQHSVISDENKWLIDAYLALKSNWRLVAEYLDKMINSSQEFLRIRGVDPWTLDLHERAAQFIYLNKTCFRGLFRVNQKGQFNVPYGEYDRRYYDAYNFEAISQSLAQVEIKSCDFDLALYGITENDFVYFDPPYYKLGGYSDFNRYTSQQFREKDQFRLAALCRELYARGVRWAVSNSDTEFVRQLFSGFHMHPISARREINLNSQERDIVELLITNYKAT